MNIIDDIPVIAGEIPCDDKRYEDIPFGERWFDDLRRGWVHHPDDFILSKTHNSRAWEGVIKLRKITPSDIDTSFRLGQCPSEARGVSLTFNDKQNVRGGIHILQVELSAQTYEWQKLRYGQRQTYHEYVEVGGGRISAVLCKMKKPEAGERLDTLRHVQWFTSMFRHDGTFHYGEPVKNTITAANPIGEWGLFVQSFYQDTDFFDQIKRDYWSL